MTDTQFLCIIHLRTVGATTRNEVAPFLFIPGYCRPLDRL